MFSFLSNWRQTPSSSDGDSDDVSSLNRSLNLPWPVTESSPRKNKNEGTATQQQQPANGMNVRGISYPMPKKALKSSTRPDNHSVTDGLPGPSAPLGATDTLPLHPFIAAPAPSSESVPWFQESAAKRKNNNSYNLRTALLQANAHAQHASITNGNTTPEVVRVDSNDAPYPRPQRTPAVYHDDLSHHGSYATYDTHPYTNEISNPSLYANYPYAHQTSHNDEGDQHEIYASPFGHSDDDEDVFFRGPNPSQTRTLTPTPSSLKGGLKLHTSSPFSQSTLQVDGLIFPPPPDTISYHYHLPTGVFPPSPQPGTPPIPTVNTDVYKNAYSYPLAKQLSPIVEQDYFSPISARGLPDSAASASPGADSVLNFGLGNGSGRERMTGEGDKDSPERGSTRTRSGRSGSAGSVKAPAMTSASGSGSLSMKEGTSSNSNPSPSGPTNGFEVTRKFSSSVACLFTN